MQWKQAKAEANDELENNEEKMKMYIVIMDLCGATAATSVQRVVWSRL